MCGIYGCSGIKDAVNHALMGAFCLQHRGQEGAGVTVWDPGQRRLNHQARLGLVAHLGEKIVPADFPGDTAISHVRYGTVGASELANVQPLMRQSLGRQIAVAHNGQFVRIKFAGELLPIDQVRTRLEVEGVCFSSSADTELMFPLIARSKKAEMTEKIIDVLENIHGAFSLLVAWEGYLVAAVDPWNFRPLCLGKINSGWAFSSESCAFDMLGVEYQRELKPGEIVIITPDKKLISRKLSHQIEPKACSFEFVYLARPDSTIFGQSVSTIRKKLAREMAQQAVEEGLLRDGDLIVAVLDSGRTTALEFSKEANRLGIKAEYDFGLIRNHYSARIFIQPGQDSRVRAVDLKHNVDRAIVKGRRIILIDDSIVRSTTAKSIVAKLYKSSAAEVHVVIPCPQIIGQCYYGIDFRTKGELAAASQSILQIRENIGAKSLSYLELGRFRQALNYQGNFCLACFDGNYPIAP